jgi:DNA topoisomerase IB
MSIKFYFREHDILNPKQFQYFDSSNKQIHDSNLLCYFKSLVIPPAYKHVKIFINHPKILFQGYDTKGRLQTIYSKDWIKISNTKKFKSLILFAKQYPKILTTLDKFMSQKTNDRNKIISIILKLILTCNFRIGNPKYEKLYNSFGILNIKKQHITINTDNTISISFIGKKKVLNVCNKVKDKIIVSFIKNRIKLINDTTDVFFEIKTPETINRWLEKTFKTKITTKMFRTYQANITFIKSILSANTHGELRMRKKIAINALNQAADDINNQASICKKSYVNGALIDLYLNNYNEFKKTFSSKSKIRQDFVSFLQNQMT